MLKAPREALFIVWREVMGCHQSKSAAARRPDVLLTPKKSYSADATSTFYSTDAVIGKGAKDTNRRSSKGPLSLTELKRRIDLAHKVETVCKNGLTLRFAYLSQRGYYPEALSKENQDAYAVPPVDAGDDELLFGVYDGHGSSGHLCARFVSERLPRFISDAIKNINIDDVAKTKNALIAAHISLNETLHRTGAIEDSFSGTTAISVLFRGRTMYVSNVGDSRAILISQEENGELVPYPLSSDQTPYRKDERERVKKCGARIRTLNQMEGKEPVHEDWGDLVLGDKIDEAGDPPRVWSPVGNYPGAAFTRSIGDHIAESLGVIADPEVLVREMQSTDKYIVIASDGVFEFLTNKKVAEIVAKKKDPITACIALAYESYEMWLDHEDRTDDITAIVIEVLPEQDRQGATDTDTDLGDITLMEERGGGGEVKDGDDDQQQSRPHFEQKRPRKSIIKSNP